MFIQKKKNLSDPIIIHDEFDGDYMLRCVCETIKPGYVMICCDECHSWLHCQCVEFPHVDYYKHPFCCDIHIKCACKKDTDFSKPLVECTKCHFYQHKNCVHLKFGPTPPGYLCHECNNANSVYKIPQPNLKNDLILFVSLDLRSLKKIPNGKLKSMIISDFKQS
jgi:hypothetical protein